MRWVAAVLVFFAVSMAPTARAQLGGTYSIPDGEQSRTLREILQLGCSDPSRYADIKRRANRTSGSPDAFATGLVFPQRNVFHVLLTDLQIYERYYPDACVRASRARQCAANTLMTAERACDCVTGYIGNTSYGVGAGEIFASEGRRVGEAACQIAANRAAAANRSRYQAQLGRAQMYDPRGTRRGFLTLQAAADAGFKRAHTDIARSYLRDIEFGGGYGAQTPQRVREAFGHLLIAQSFGALDTYSVVVSFNQLKGVRENNVRALELWNQINR